MQIYYKSIRKLAGYLLVHAIPVESVAWWLSLLYCVQNHIHSSSECQAQWSSLGEASRWTLLLTSHPWSATAPLRASSRVITSLGHWKTLPHTGKALQCFVHNFCITHSLLSNTFAPRKRVSQRHTHRALKSSKFRYVWRTSLVRVAYFFERDLTYRTK